MNILLISKFLRLLRKEHGYTQEDLAKLLSISRQAVSKWETGTTIPDLETLLKLSNLYHLTMNDIIEPNVQAKIIHDFEQIIEIPEIKLKEILDNFNINDIIKATMGASPEVNTLLEKLFSEINFRESQNKIGRVKLEEVEDIQNQIVALINLEVLH